MPLKCARIRLELFPIYARILVYIVRIEYRVFSIHELLLEIMCTFLISAICIVSVHLLINGANKEKFYSIIPA